MSKSRDRSRRHWRRVNSEALHRLGLTLHELELWQQGLFRLRVRYTRGR